MTNIFITGLLALGLFVVFYRLAVRPLLRLAFIERIEEREKALEQLAESGKVSRSDFAYQFMSKQFQVKNHLSHFCVSGFLNFLICRDKDTKPDADSERFSAEAGPELSEIHNAVRRDLLRWMVVNSPSYTIAALVLIGFVMVYKSMDEKRIQTEAFIFADLEAKSCAC